MSSLTLRMVGDNLLSSDVQKSVKKDGGYDFREIYSEISPLIKEADIAIVDQETILVSDPQKVSDFPFFGTPKEAADALVDAGFNVIMQGTNHALDKGYAGLCNDIDIWRRFSDKVLLLGIYDSNASAGKIPVIERNGIRIALLNYTQSLNYHIKFPGRSYCVNTMRRSDRKRIAGMIAQAHKEADLVVVLPHWGVEYLYEPVESQKKWAAFFANAGADLIIGTHPHVLQYKETLTADDGRKVPCLYSLGNFISTHMNLQGVVIGGMADIKITKDVNGVVRITDYDIIPTVTATNEDFKWFRVRKLEDYTNEMAESSKLIRKINKHFDDNVDADRLKKIYKDIMDRKAINDSIFRKPSDVFFYDVSKVFGFKRRNKRR